MSGNGAFEGLFTHAETCEERRLRQEKVLRSAERVAKGMKREAGQAMVDRVEIQIFGHLLTEDSTDMDGIGGDI